MRSRVYAPTRIGRQLCRPIHLAHLLGLFFLGGLRLWSQNGASGGLRVTVPYSDANADAIYSARVFELQAVSGVRRAVARPCLLLNKQILCKELPTGDYLVMLEPAEGARNVDAVMELPTFYPGTTDASRAESVHVSEGGEAQISMRGIAQTARPIHLTLPPSASSPTIVVERITEDLRLPGMTFNPQPGTGIITPPLPSGDYELNAEWSQNGVTHHAKAAFRHEGTREDHVTLEEWFPTTLLGSATGAAPGTIQSIHLVPMTDTAKQVTAKLRADGQFRVSALLPGKYWLIPSDPSFVVSELEEGGASRLGDVLVVPETGGTVQVSVRLSHANGKLFGKLDTLDSSRAHAGVSLRDQDSGETRTALANAAGYFRFDNLPNGSYRLDGWQRLDTAAYRDRQTLIRVRNNSQSITISDGEVLPPMNVAMNQND